MVGFSDAFFRLLKRGLKNRREIKPAQSITSLCAGFTDQC